MKLRSKTLLFTGLPLLLLIALVAGLLLRQLYATRMELGQQRLLDQVAKVATRVSAKNEYANRIARAMALTQEAGMFGDSARSLKFLQGLIAAHPVLNGVYFCYEPSAPGTAGKSAITGAGTDATGRFVPYYFRPKDSSEAVLVPALHMDSSYYYRGVKNALAGKPEAEGVTLEGGISALYQPPSADQAREAREIVVEPFNYEGSANVPQVSPILIEGRFAGVAGVNLTLDDIDNFMLGMRSYKTGQFLLVSKRGRMISATMAPDLRWKVLEQTPYGPLLKDFYLSKDQQMLSLIDDPITGERRFLVGARVPTGDWTLWMTVSEQEVLAPVQVQEALAQVALIVGIGLMVVLLLGYLFFRGLVGRVERAAAAATGVAGGDLTVNIDSSVRDESGVLLRAIRKMVSSLESLVLNLKGSSVELISTANEVSAAARAQKEFNSHFGASTSQIAASINEISATSRELLETMKEVNEATTQSATVAARGRHDLDRMEDTMQHLSSATGSISAKLGVIAERAGNIGAVVTTITKVAEQTNLLSLNAAIEAEKAGEYGLGFSVIAREIRRLADQTAVATLDIERIVGEMQSSVSSGVMEMDRFGEQVRIGVSEATTLGEELAEIILSVEKLKPRFESAHHGMQAQVLGASQINEAMLRLREAALISEEAALGLDGNAQQLLSAVDALKLAVGRFTTA
jgi:methyl-accepting chemotaxis protein